MISTISAYKDIRLAISGEKTNKQLPTGEGGVSGTAPHAVSSAEQVGRASPGNGADAVSVDLSASHDVFSAVDDYFNMGRSGRFDAFHKLSRDDKEQFVQIVAELAKSGYMGYEELVVNKKVERHDITTQIGDERLRGAHRYDRPKTAGS